jgi:hypothetical protein
VVAVVTYCLSQELAPFYIQFIGEDNSVVFTKDHVSFGHAFNLCVKICKYDGWCSALRKCADSHLSFRCHVKCRIQETEVNIPKPRDGKCHVREVGRYLCGNFLSIYQHLNPSRSRSLVLLVCCKASECGGPLDETANTKVRRLID